MHTRCYRHYRQDTFPAACPTCARLAVEIDIVTRTVDVLLAAGFALTINDSVDCYRPAVPTTDRAAILAELMETDDDLLLAVRPTVPGVPADRYRVRRDVRFIYGNGVDVLSDYSLALDAVLAPVHEYLLALPGFRHENTGGSCSALAKPYAYEDDKERGHYWLVTDAEGLSAPLAVEPDGYLVGLYDHKGNGLMIWSAPTAAEVALIVEGEAGDGLTDSRRPTEEAYRAALGALLELFDDLDAGEHADFPAIANARRVLRGEG